jgi:NAD(P)-dependent dehydrogenase (short-subunit alcohol dehydrogenase family)
VREFSGKVAVITGAASGVGRGMAERFGRAGMQIVLADIEGPALGRTAGDLQRLGVDVLPVVTDVANADSVATLANAALDRFGAIHVLCNNAGVFPQGRLRRAWEHPLEDWQWTLGVNLFGVIHGIRTFVPIMLDQAQEAHIVNTASVTGFVNGVGGTPYAVSKFGVVRLTEGLYAGLRDINAPIGVSLLIPGLVQTAIRDAERNRPAALRPAAGVPEEAAAITVAVTGPVGLTAAHVAEMTFDAIRENRFYVFTSDVWDDALRKRSNDILARRPPDIPDIVELVKCESAAGNVK